MPILSVRLSDAEHAAFTALSRDGGAASVSSLLRLLVTQSIAHRSTTAGVNLALAANRADTYAGAVAALSRMQVQLARLQPRALTTDPKVRERFISLRQARLAAVVPAGDATSESADEMAGLTDAEITAAMAIPAGPKRDRFIESRRAKHAKNSAKKAPKK
jgi:hypothetical protein